MLLLVCLLSIWTSCHANDAFSYVPGESSVIEGYGVCGLEALIRLPDYSWMAIGKDNPKDRTPYGRARITQWKDWRFRTDRDSGTPLLVKTNRDSPLLKDFLGIHGQEVSATFFHSYDSRLVVFISRITLNQSKNRVIFYEPLKNYTLFYKEKDTSIEEYLPFVKDHPSLKNRTFKRVLASTYVSGSSHEADRIIIRLWYDKLLAQVKLYSNRTLDQLIEIPLREDTSKNIISSALSVVEFDEESQTYEFITSTSGFWSRVVTDKSITKRIDLVNGSDILITNSFFGCPDSLCFRGEIDAALESNDEGIFIFRNQHYWILDKGFSPESQVRHPQLIIDRWPQLLGYFDAATTVTMNEVEKVIVFQSDSLDVAICGMKGNCSMSELQDIFSGAENVLSAITNSNNEIILITDLVILTYNWTSESGPASLVENATIFQVFGVDSLGVEDALLIRGEDDILYIFLGGYYQRLSTNQSEPQEEPKLNAGHLYNCDDLTGLSKPPKKVDVKITYVGLETSRQRFNDTVFEGNHPTRGSADERLVVHSEVTCGTSYPPNYLLYSVVLNVALIIAYLTLIVGYVIYSRALETEIHFSNVNG